MFKPFEMLSADDRVIAERYIGSLDREPDLTIAPDGAPYLYRWAVIPRNKTANVYFHMQVADDPERPLHDHPWDNTSVILAGGYNEQLQWEPPYGYSAMLVRQRGDVVHRIATAAHRLFIPRDIRYTLTQFSTGPTIRAWGFWGGVTWVDAEEMTTTTDRVSVHKREKL